MVREKGIDKDILVGIVEDIFGMMVRKKYAQRPNTMSLNMDKGDIEIYSNGKLLKRSLIL